MSSTYSVASARANLAEIVDQVQSGRDVEITRRGEKVAVLVSASRYALLQNERPTFMDAFESFRQTTDLAAVGVDRDWARGLRHDDVGRDVKL